MVIALSHSVSCSRAYLCLPQSRCFSSDEYCTKDMTHPSSGQKNRSLSSSLQLSSSSLLFPFYGASSKTGFCFGLLLALAVWKDLPEPIPYGLQTCKPSLVYSMLLMKLTPSHFTGLDFAAGCGPLTVTRTPEIPPDYTMAVIICEAVSMSWPELRWCACDF